MITNTLKNKFIEKYTSFWLVNENVKKEGMKNE